MSRFLLIGLDGLEPSLAAPWMDDGTLPNLAALRSRGTFLRCQSVEPPVTFPAWTTCVTGVNPGRHGVFDFTEVDHAQQQIRFVNSTHRRAPALWNVLSDAGKRVGVLGVPATYPPEPVNGFMVSGFDSPVATAVDRSFVHPASLYDDVRDWRFADVQESNIGEGWHAHTLAKLLAKIEDKESVTLNLFNREPWDFFMVVFGESDTIAHHFWMFHDKNSPRFRNGFETAIRQIYKRLDTTVGKLMDAAGDDVTIGIVSDHGFGGAGTGVVHLNNWLAEHGYLQYSGGGGSIAKQIALRTVPARWRGTMFRMMRGVATRAESRDRFAGIDWPNTTAWSEELNYFPSIRVNVAGRDRNGVVPASEYDSFCATLCSDLESWDAIKQARPRSTVFDGPHADAAPDIIIELALEDGYSHSCLRARGGEAFRRLRPEEYVGGKERGMNGNHRPVGVLMLSKPVAARFASLEDVAPTVLADLGVPGPPMDGTSLLGPMAEAETDVAPRDQRAYSPEENAEIENRLRELGYFE
jgi:predicted AlkP superfamily phosphohydrolase/phosphomutase